MEPLELGKFIVQLIRNFEHRINIVTECNQGEAIIVKRLGYPLRWRNTAGWYFKWPFADMFDKVDIRQKYVQLNAHSFHEEISHNETVPYNILIDFQVEYQVINPLVIYESYGYDEDEEVALSYINNTIHQTLSEMLQRTTTDITYSQVKSCLDKLVKELHKEPFDEEEIRHYDDRYRKKKRTRKEVNVQECISINEIVITSFDKNISLRTTI